VKPKNQHFRQSKIRIIKPIIPGLFYKA